MLNNIEGIAFDLDGTLYPNYRFNLILLPFILKEFRLLYTFGKTREIIRKEQEKPGFKPKPGDSFYKWQAEINAKLLGTEIQSAYDKIETLIYRGWEPLFKKVKLFKNVREALAAIKKAGYKLALLSDFPPDAKLEYMGLNGFWDTIFCSERCGALKPHPLSFLELANAMSLPPEKILYVGNSHSYDVAGAAGVGMKTGWIKSPFPPGKGLKKPRADFIFNNYRQIIKIMV